MGKKYDSYTRRASNVRNRPLHPHKLSAHPLAVHLPRQSDVGCWLECDRRTPCQEEYRDISKYQASSLGFLCSEAQCQPNLLFFGLIFPTAGHLTQAQLAAPSMSLHSNLAKPTTPSHAQVPNTLSRRPSSNLQRLDRLPHHDSQPLSRGRRKTRVHRHRRDMW